MDIMRPMYAVAESPEKLETRWNDPNYVMELKLDGIREICYWDNVRNRFFGRRISVKDGKPVEKTDNLPALRDFKIPAFQDCVFDGEIVSPHTPTTGVSDFKIVESIMGSKPERATALQEEHGLLKYMVFDILIYKGKDVTALPLKERRTLLVELFGEAGFDAGMVNPYPIVLLPQFAGDGQILRALAREYFRAGCEGVILKDINASYRQDKRPANVWIKVKKIDTEDVVIIGSEPASIEYTGKDTKTWMYWETPKGQKIKLTDFDGKRHKKSVMNLVPEGSRPITRLYYNGWIGALRFAQWVKDTEANRETYKKTIVREENNRLLIDFGECGQFTDEEFVEFTNYLDKHIGKVIEIEYMERYPTGKFRHARFCRLRTDKGPEDCVYEPAEG